MGSASAALSYPFDGQLAPSGGSFGNLEANSVAVDDSNGKTYVADSAAGVVDVFETATRTQLPSLDGSLTPAGSFGGNESFSGLGVRVAANNGTGYVYVLDPIHGVVDVFEGSGSYHCQITDGLTPSASECNGPSGSGIHEVLGGGRGAAGITIDQATGEIYVLDAYNETIYILSAGGAYQRQISLASIVGGFNGKFTRGIAVSDFNGHVYVSDSGAVVLYEFNAAGEYLTTWHGANTPARSFGSGYLSVAADDASGRVYVTETTHGVTDVFEPTGSYLTQFSHSFGQPFGTAVGQASHKIYVSDNQPSVVDIFGPGPVVVPDVTTGSFSNAQSTSVTLGGAVNPDGIQVTACRFEYGTSTSYGQSAPCSSLPSGEEPVSVSASLIGLSPLTAYHYRLTATNANGENNGHDETFTTPVRPTVEESVTNVTSGAATLNALINPGGGDTRYRFEYGSSTAYGASAPVPDGDVAAGTADVAQSVLVEGLSPGTTYHYRVVAFNSAGTAEGPDRVFATQAGEAPGLLDGRAWELVSPPDKRGAALEPISVSPGAGAIQAARDGGAVSYLASAPVDADPAGNRSLAPTQVLSTRGQGGWSSRGITTPNEPPVFGIAEGNASSEYMVFSDDLSVGLVEPAGETPLSPQASERTVYRREANGEYTPLVTADNVPTGTKFGRVDFKGGIVFRGASLDLSHVVLSSPHALTPGFVGDLYEWAGGSLRPVSVLPNGEGSYGDLGVLEGGYVRHAVSDDGSRIFWSGRAEGEDHLYMRDMSLGKTVQLDAIEEGAQGSSPSIPLFQTASRDGSKVFFTDTRKLTVDATSREGKPDLYMCEIGEAAGKPTCRLKDLTVDENTGEAASVQGVVIGAGEDGRYVYFVAGGVLAAGAAPGGENLYVYDTVSDKSRLVAVLSSEDAGDWTAAHDKTGELSGLSSRVSPNGRYLAFMSERSLTGYNNIDAHSGQADEEVFLYDVSTGRVVCASCNPSGARPTGVLDPPGQGMLVDRPGVWGGHWLAASIPGWTRAGFSAWYQSRYLSDSGRLFFNAADALVPRDTNGREDVYEYEPNGVGGCAQATGCVGLMSSGTSGEESAFLDATATGGEVFFLTASRLTGQDVDGALDVYDARVCSASSPCLTAPSVPAPPCTSGESCRGAALSQPEAFAVPSSMGVSGAGNLAPAAGGPAVKAKRVTRAQRLSRARRACRKKPKPRRAACEAQARRAYGSGVKAKRAGDAGATRKGNR